jgi:preprotein translocase subunit SecA
LADWARAKFGIELTSDELATAPAGEVVEIIDRKVREAYARREVYYPIESLLNHVFASAGTDNVYALQQIVAWANSKFNVGWTPETLADKTVDAIANELVTVSRRFLEEGLLDREIDQALERFKPSSNGELKAWAAERFGRAIDIEALEKPDTDQRELLRQAGRELVRWELTQLERYVLLRIYDQSWKDHLLEMDHLKNAIMQRPLGGDQTHPQSQYAIEGRDLFEQMWKIIRARVTDMIFKVSGGPAGGGGDGGTTTTGGGPGGASPQMQMRHDSAAGAGFSGNADQEAAMRAQGEAKVATIRREQPKVGRNDPCPCGSGKKYKQCHGKK